MRLFAASFLLASAVGASERLDHLLRPEIWKAPFQDIPGQQKKLPKIKSTTFEKWNLYREILESFEGLKNLSLKVRWDCFGGSQEEILSLQLKYAEGWKSQFEQNCLSNTEDELDGECFDIHARFRSLSFIVADFSNVIVECQTTKVDARVQRYETKSTAKSYVGWNTNPNGVSSETTTKSPGQWESGVEAGFDYGGMVAYSEGLRLGEFVRLKLGAGHWNALNYYYDTNMGWAYRTGSLEFLVAGDFDRRIYRKRAELLSQQVEIDNKVSADGTFMFPTKLGIRGEANYAKIDTSEAVYSGKETKLKGSIFSNSSGLLRKGIFAAVGLFKKDEKAIATNSSSVQMGFELEGTLMAGGQGTLTAGVDQRRDAGGLNRIYPKFNFQMETPRMYGFLWQLAGPAEVQLTFDLGYEVRRGYWSSAAQTLFSHSLFRWFFNKNAASLGLGFEKVNYAGSPGSGRENVDTYVRAGWEQNVWKDLKWVTDFEYKNSQVVFGQIRDDLWLNPYSYNSFFLGTGIKYEF